MLWTIVLLEQVKSGLMFPRMSENLGPDWFPSPVRRLLFIFENGDLHRVEMSKNSFWIRIEPLFTTQDYVKYELVRSCLTPCSPLSGEIVTRMWDICKMANFVSQQDTRRPVTLIVY